MTRILLFVLYLNTVFYVYLMWRSQDWFDVPVMAIMVLALCLLAYQEGRDD